MMDRTLKMRAYNSAAGTETSNLTREQELELALTKKTAQAEDERKKALDTLTVLEQVREVHKRDLARLAELQGQLTSAQSRVKELEAALGRIASLAIAPGRASEE
jgi:t-SNARE complex subunit (syntaxin)